RPPGTLFLHSDTMRPPIEDVLDPDSVIQLLPRDQAGNIDWVAALRSGVIAPRPTVSGIDLPPEVPRFAFGFDFYFPGPNPTFDAFFPHSAHTEWVDCAQCHARIFRYRGTEIKMADVLQGRYCGECHGKVSFPPVTACERCHQELPQPPNRAQPILLGTLTMKRMLRAPEPVADSTALIAKSPADSNAVADPDPAIGGTPPVRAGRTFVTASLPPSVFPHWVHRIRFQCRVCHLELFEPRLGANDITMAAIDEGRFCGRCHDGDTAFDVSFDSCQRCHQPPEQDTE
ncbi:MAG: hypothetical protein OEM23_00740, partial [Gemmatimonadota bacterium]|nr:hypothetical protein [Gemmatimonadota bacterium]